MTRTKKREEQPQEEVKEVIYNKKQLDQLLKRKHKLVAQEYVRNGWNKKRAYMSVYTKVGEKTAEANGCKLLGRTKLKQYVEFIKNDLEELCGISKAKQLKEYSKIAYSSVARLHLKWITLKDFDLLVESDPEIMDAIEVVDTKTVWSLDDDKNPLRTEYVKIKMYSKINALQRIDKLLDYETDQKVKVTGDVTTNLGTGSVEAIRAAFNLDNAKDPTQDEVNR